MLDATTEHLDSGPTHLADIYPVVNPMEGNLVEKVVEGTAKTLTTAGPETPTPGSMPVPEEPSLELQGDEPLKNLEDDEPTGTEDITARETREDNSEPEMASLYCKVNYRSHASLSDFGVTECPKCNQDLSHPTPVDERKNAKDISHAAEERSRTPTPEPKDHSGDILHEIEYVDNGDNFISREAWEGPFDLAKAREGVVIATKGTPVATVTTILTTNISGDHYRTPMEVQELVDEGFLTNPTIEMISVKKSLRVFSVPFLGALNKVVTYYPSVTFGTSSIRLQEPFPILAHHIDELKAFASTFSGSEGESPSPSSTEGVSSSLRGSLPETCSETANEHIGRLLGHLQDYLYGAMLREEKARYELGSPLCTYPMLWLLYKPGTTVYKQWGSSGRMEAFVIQEVEIPSGVLSLPAEDLEPYRIHLWHLDFDGTYIRRAGEMELITSFDGERPISSLAIKPAAFVDKADGGKTRHQLISNGKKWFGLLRGGQQQHYKGQTLTEPRRDLDKRVVVDIKSYLNLYNHAMGDFDVQDLGEGIACCPCESCLSLRQHPPSNFPWIDYDMIDPKEARTLELPEAHQDRDHPYLLCTRRVIGFILKSRNWEFLDVECCQPATINRNAIDTLVMEDNGNRNIKRMIQAIVQKYTDPSFVPGKKAVTQPWKADFIENKGTGQIFLLHGGPGVGKTYTAECISESIGRPLLSLTCADVGLEEVEMENKLLDWFNLAESWGAVMLLDEADVWLERRQIADLKRNSMVAVFLRCLEYYRGILFLTSNRVLTFDDAFVSRIHVVVHYPELGPNQRNTIWKQFFDKLEKDRGDTIRISRRAKSYILEDEEIREIDWNGREIRNAFQTAVALAEYRYHNEGGKEKGGEMVVLDQRDFEEVCQMSLDFKKYLKVKHGGADESDRAYRNRTRA